MAKTYSLYEAKARFSEVIAHVRKHARVIITHRGTPVAQILPLDIEPDNLLDRLALLEKDGHLSTAPLKKPKWKSIVKKTGALSRFLQGRD